MRARAGNLELAADAAPALLVAVDSDRDSPRAGAQLGVYGAYHLGIVRPGMSFRQVWFEPLHEGSSFQSTFEPGVRVRLGAFDLGVSLLLDVNPPELPRLVDESPWRFRFSAAFTW